MPIVREAPGQDAFSLTDLVVGLALGLIVMAMLVSFFAAQHRHLGEGFLRGAARQELRAVMDLVTTDLRTAGRRAPDLAYTTGDDGPGACLEAGKALRLVADLDGDGATDGANEDVLYCLCAPDAHGRRVLVRSYRPTDGSVLQEEPLLRNVIEAGVERPSRRTRFVIEVAVDGRGGTITEGVVRDVALRNTPGVRSCVETYACSGEACS